MPRKSTETAGTTVETSSRVIHVRLDSDTEAALDSYMAVMNLNRSQAVRTLIYTAARAEMENPEVALHAAAVREGMILGLREIKKRVEESFKNALAGMEQVG